MGEISKYISITKEWDLFQHHSSRSQIALFKQQNNARKIDRNPIVLLLTKVLKRTQLHSDPIRTSVITVKSVLSEQRKPGITEIWARAFSCFCITLFQAQGPRRKMLQACVLEVSWKVFPNCFVFHVPGNSVKKNSIVGTASLLELGKGVLCPSIPGVVGKISAAGCPPWSTAPAQPRLPAAQAPGNKQTQQNNKPTSILTKSQVLRQIPLTWMLQHITSSSGP